MEVPGKSIFINGNAGTSGYGLYIMNSSGQLEILMGGVVFSASSATLPIGVRSTVAIVRNAGTWSVYVNGVQYSIANPTATPFVPNTGFFIGCVNDGTGVFNGVISNVAFWNVARSNTQIASDLSACTLAPQTGLTGYWTLGEGSGTTAHDISGNANNLTIANTPWIATPAAYSYATYLTYTWSFGDGSTSTIANPAHTYTVPGIYTTSLSVTSASVCTGIATNTITVNTTPATGTLTGTTVVCQGATTVLSDTLIGGIWSSNNTSVVTVSSTGTLTGVTGGTANISYTFNNGCVASATATVTVNAATPMFSTAPAAAICINLPITYTTQSGQSNYIWTVSGVSGTDYNITAGGVGSSDTTVTLTWLTTGVQTVTANYTSPTGCTAIAAATNVTTTSNAYPLASYSVNPNPACVNNATAFNITSSASGWCSNNVLYLSDGYDYLYSNTNVASGPSFTFETWLQWAGRTRDCQPGYILLWN